MSETPEQLSVELLTALHAALDGVDVITTLADGRPNWVGLIEPAGVWLETEQSRKKDSGPQLVPATMINAGWNYLRSSGSLTNRHLLSASGLNVKRSSAVCVLLSRLPDVDVVSSRPIELRYRSAGGS